MFEKLLTSIGIESLEINTVLKHNKFIVMVCWTEAW